MSPLQIKDQVITPLDKVRDLGVIIDSKLTMESHTVYLKQVILPSLGFLMSVTPLGWPW